jgi:hypothetical protein
MESKMGKYIKVNVEICLYIIYIHRWDCFMGGGGNCAALEGMYHKDEAPCDQERGPGLVLQVNIWVLVSGMQEYD